MQRFSFVITSLLSGKMSNGCTAMVMQSLEIEITFLNFRANVLY